MYYFFSLKIYFYFLRYESPYVAHAALEHSILLPQLSWCWDYRQVPPHLADNTIFK
jgi:hypothetical protein